MQVKGVKIFLGCIYLRACQVSCSVGDYIYFIQQTLEGICQLLVKCTP